MIRSETRSASCARPIGTAPQITAEEQMPAHEAERSLVVAIPLTLSGGFLDAFTYVGHGHVFANSMTGNVALLGVSVALGNWTQALRHVPPLLAFVLAILASNLLQTRAAKAWLKRPGIATLCLEASFITVAASHLFNLDDAWLIPGISFTATLQTMAFTHLEALTYTSVMTTGNLRRCTQQLISAFFPARNPTALHEAWLLGVISLSFLLGATGGAFLTRRWGDLSLFCVSALLLFAFFEILKDMTRQRADFLSPGALPRALHAFGGGQYSPLRARLG